MNTPHIMIISAVNYTYKIGRVAKRLEIAINRLMRVEKKKNTILNDLL